MKEVIVKLFNKYDFAMTETGMEYQKLDKECRNETNPEKKEIMIERLKFMDGKMAVYNVIFFDLGGIVNNIQDETLSDRTKKIL